MFVDCYNNELRQEIVSKINLVLHKWKAIEKTMIEDNEKKFHPLRLKHYAWALAVFWTAFMSASLIWNIHQAELKTIEVARVQSHVAYDKDILYRSWNAEHGGVYVPVTDKTKPNPYLSEIKERDITTPSGKLLTLMNPAYMTRQVFELAEIKNGVLGHITSLNPICPGNAADPWEAEALRSFDKGETEISSIEEIEGKEYLRLMHPLITEESCLQCHAVQGYKEGDIRGGISSSIPMEPLYAIYRKESQRYTIFYIFIWLTGMGIIFLGIYSLKKSEQKRIKTEKALKEREENLAEIVSSIPVGIIIQDEKTGKITSVNMFALSMICTGEENIIGKDISEFIRLNADEAYLSTYSGGEDVPILIVNTSLHYQNKSQILHSFIDISERKHAEKERLQNEKLQGVLEMAGAACHELNQPLQTILGYSSLISSRLTEDNTVKSQIKIISEQADKMGKITRRLQNISKYETTEYLDGKIIDIKKASA